MLRSSSLESLGELASIVSVDNDLPTVSLDESQPVVSESVIQDYTEDLSLYELNAKIIYRSLLWEQAWKKQQYQDDETPVINVPDTNQTSKSTVLKKMGLFASSLINTMANKSAQMSLLHRASLYMLLRGNDQRLMITSMGSAMLRHYCEEENPDNPSIIFDMIIVGTMVLTLAVDDALDDLKGQSPDDHLYPVALSVICDSCELHRRYASPQQYAHESSLVNHVVQYLILQLGYRVLIEKSLPFNAALALDYFSQLSSIFPIKRFDRYQLKAVNHDAINHGACLNWSGNDVSVSLAFGDVYQLWMLRKCASDDLPEDQVFNRRCHSVHAM